MDSTTLRPEPPSSPSLGYAVACGLPARMSYTIGQTARYTGLSEYQLKAAITSGELAAAMPTGNLRGARIPVRAVDAYMGYAT